MIMLESLLSIAFSFGSLFFLWRLVKRIKMPIRPASSPLTEPCTSESRVKLTNNQITALMCASFDQPIYAENPRFINAQMPNGVRCFALRTVESLVKRGYLISNEAGGYLLTKKGLLAVKSASGF